MILSDLRPSEALRILRQRDGATQEQAAERCGIDVRTWIDFEKGRTLPGLEPAVAIEREFGIPVAEWTKRTDTEAA